MRRKIFHLLCFISILAPSATATAQGYRPEIPAPVFLRSAPRENHADFRKAPPGEIEFQARLRVPSKTHSADPPINLLMNPTLLWGIIFIESLAIAVLGYYQWKIRTARKEYSQSGQSMTNPALNVDFSALSHSDQFDRLQEIAVKAIQHYPLELSRISKLRYRSHASFIVEALPTEKPEEGIKKYFLKIFTPGVQTIPISESELHWLNAILRETSLSVPKPLANHEGAYSTKVEHNGIPEVRHCTIVSWLEGTSPHKHMTAEILEEVGVFIGKLHQQVVGYKPHAGFERKRWDLAGFNSEMLYVPVTKIRRGLTKGQIEIIEMATSKIQNALGILEQGPEVYGLIHSNLQERKYLVHRGEIRAVDFTSCGWGFFGYDLAVTLSQLVNQPNFPQLRAALLDGYQQVRLIGGEIEGLLGTFIAGRYVYDLLSIASHQNEPEQKDKAALLIDRYIDYLDRFLQRG